MGNNIREQLVDYLKGSYTESGIEKWFDRPRVVLSGKTPNEVIQGDDPQEINLLLELAKSLRYL